MSVTVKAGGKGANQAVALAKAGAHVFMGGCMGKEGDWILQLMQEAGVDTSLITVDAALETGKAIIQLATEEDHGENSVILFHGANFSITPNYIEGLLSKFNAGDLLVLQNEISCGKDAMIAAKSKGMHVVFSPAPMTSEILSQYPFELVDVLCMNQVEAQDLHLELCEELRLTQPYSTAGLIQLLKGYFPNLCAIVLTRGKEGVFAHIKGKDYHQSAILVENVVDTTGAGDVFLGYLVAQLVQQGWSPHSAQDEEKRVHHALKAAVHAASLCIQTMGAMNSIPPLKQVTRAMDVQGMK